MPVLGNFAVKAGDVIHVEAIVTAPDGYVSMNYITAKMDTIGKVQIAGETIVGVQYRFAKGDRVIVQRKLDTEEMADKATVIVHDRSFVLILRDGRDEADPPEVIGAQCLTRDPDDCR